MLTLLIYLIAYLGPPFVFGFNSIASNCGLIGRNAACIANNNTYWMGNYNFFILKFLATRDSPLSLPW